MIQVVLILLLSIPIFQFRVYWLIVDAIGVGLAYFIDQFLPLIVTSIMAFVIIRKNVPIGAIKKYASANGIPILMIIISSLVVHGLVLGNYFMGEEPTTILSGVTNGDGTALIQGILRGYHYGIYILSNQLFYTNTILYNVVALVLYIFTAIVLYIFLNQLFNKKVIPALVGALFFITTPAYMDMFFWQSNFSGMPIALSAGILSLIFLCIYQKASKSPYSKRSNFVYYVLSIMFYLSMLKIGFVRLHAFIALPLFMCLFPAMSERLSRLDVRRFVFSATPFLLILLSYLLMVFILPDHVFEKGVTVRGATLNTEGYLVVLSMLVAYLFIPSQFAEAFYPKIKYYLLASTDISVTLLFGIFGTGVLIIVCLVALRYIQQIWGRLIIFALVTIFAHLVFTPLFLQGYNDPAGVDQRFSNTGVSNGPGIRYVFVSAMGLSLLVGVIAYWILAKSRKYRIAFYAFMLLLFGYYSYLGITSYISALKNIHPGQSAVPDSVFSMVPKDGKKKLLYSVNPEYNAIDSKIGDWLHAFYKLDELKYTNSLEDVLKNIASGMYRKDDFYAFYNNPLTQTFKDVSVLTRSELYQNKANQKVQFIQHASLTTSFTNTDNTSNFPLVLNRGIYISEELNQRLLLPRQLSISIHKRKLPEKYPYVDAFVVTENGIWQGSPFPMNVWDRLKNRPVFVETKQMDLALNAIDKFPYEARIKIAKELVGREKLKNQPGVTMSDIEQANKHYIDSQEILNTFLDSPSFNSLTLVYACAEDVDWEKQKKSSETIGGIWYVREFPLNRNRTDEQMTISLTCFGSILRKIILVGPPVPSEIIIEAVASF